MDEDEHAEELFQITLKEAAEKHWLEGSLSVPELDEIFHKWAASSEVLCFIAWKASSY